MTLLVVVCLRAGREDTRMRWVVDSANMCDVTRGTCTTQLRMTSMVVAKRQKKFSRKFSTRKQQRQDAEIDGAFQRYAAVVMTRVLHSGALQMR